jgi:hypothetical protein
MSKTIMALSLLLITAFAAVVGGLMMTKAANPAEQNQATTDAAVSASSVLDLDALKAIGFQVEAAGNTTVSAWIIPASSDTINTADQDKVNSITLTSGSALDLDALKEMGIKVEENGTVTVSGGTILVTPDVAASALSTIDQSWMKANGILVEGSETIIMGDSAGLIPASPNVAGSH